MSGEPVVKVSLSRDPLPAPAVDERAVEVQALLDLLARLDARSVASARAVQKAVGEHRSIGLELTLVRQKIAERVQ